MKAERFLFYSNYQVLLALLYNSQFQYLLYYYNCIKGSQAVRSYMRLDWIFWRNCKQMSKKSTTIVMHHVWIKYEWPLNQQAFQSNVPVWYSKPWQHVYNLNCIVMIYTYAEGCGLLRHNIRTFHPWRSCRSAARSWPFLVSGQPTPDRHWWVHTAYRHLVQNLMEKVLRNIILNIFFLR